MHWLLYLVIQLLLGIKMNKNKMIFLVIGFLAFLSVDSAVADENNSGKILKENSIKKNYKSRQLQTIEQGDRANYHYRYYPHRKVYYCTEKEIFYYFNGKNWEINKSLPNHLKNDLGKYVNLILETDRPYLLNEEHDNKYSGKSTNPNKRNVNFFTKIWIVLLGKGRI